MTKQQLNLEKKKRGRPSIGRGDQLNLMVRPEMAEAIDAAALAQADSPSRTEMTRRILADWLAMKGFLGR